MPLNNPSPNFALLSGFNARTWSNVNVFDRGSNNVTLPTFTTGQGLYDDVISFLNGRGSESGFAMSDLLQTASNFGANWSITINSSDKVLISCDDSFKIRLKAGDDILGVGSSTYGTAATSFTSPNDWTRGSNLKDSQYEFQNAAGSTTFSFDITGKLNVQDLIVAIRERGTTNDVDDVNTSNNLEKLDLNVNTSSNYIKWYINDDGHVECMYFSAIADITWVSTSFRNRLGFSGNESPSGTLIRTLTADHPCPGALYPSRPYQDHHLQIQTVSQSRRKIGGGFASNFVGSYIQSSLLFDLDALLDQIDLYRHFTNNFIGYIGNGERITFYQNVGDSRRSLTTGEVNLGQPAYDLLYTSEDNGNTGRIRGSLVDSDAINLGYPNRLKRRVPVSLVMEHL